MKLDLWQCRTKDTTDIEEEGRTTLVKYSIPFELDAHTTIIATANQYDTEWESANSVSKDEFPILKTLVDRSDQIYAFRDAPSVQELEDYVKQKTKIRKHRPHNYNFLKKLLIYVRTTIKPEISAESEYMLNKFWTEARLKGVATNRTYDAIFRLAEAQAKLNLRNEVDDDIVTQIMESLALMLAQYGEVVQAIQSPKDVAYNAFLNVLRQTKAPLSVKELHKIACDENKQISQYLGSVYNIRDNHKLRVVVDMLLNHGSIRQIQDKPIVIQWLSDTSDISDTKTKPSNLDDKNESQSRSHASHMSPKLKHNSYFSSGKWHCNDCKASGDKFYMENTNCTGASRNEKRNKA
jgi:DNA replicative helicase MCM subunit Mcm2 (Cdc46/Mcm family)